MTSTEKIVISAHTGYLMCDLKLVIAYLEGKTTNSFISTKIGTSFWDRARELSKSDFIDLCDKD